MTLAIEQVELGDSRLRNFVRVPWRLFQGNPYWTPPLNGELLGSRLLGLKGLLTPEHPYHQDADVTHFVARDGRRLLGRISAAVNHRFNAHYGSTIGFFGFFEVVDDFVVAEALLDHARDWIRNHGMTVIRGPGAYSNAATEAHQAVLVDGFDTPPTVELTHNPPYYGEFLEKYGLAKAKDYHAYKIALVPPSERLIRVAKAVQQRRNIETRMVVMKDLRAEVGRIVQIYNEAWADNWGFLPITTAEGDATADNLKMVIDPGLMRFATVNGELAAVLGALPDPNIPFRPRWNRFQDTDIARALRLLRTRRQTPVMRLMFFGVVPKFRNLGIDALLYLQVQDYAVQHGYTMCEPSMLLEDNDLILRASASMDGEQYKTWRVHEMNL